MWETSEIQRGFLWGGLNEREHFEDLVVDRRKIIKCIFKRWDAAARVGLIWLMTERGVGLFVIRIKIGGSIKSRKFLD